MVALGSSRFILTWITAEVYFGRMKASLSPWHGRRVLVTGFTGFLGAAVTRELLARGATVIGLLRRRTTGQSRSPVQNSGRVHVVYGRAEDVARMHSAMAIHEVSAVFHLARVSPNAMLHAAERYHPQLPVVTALPAEPLRLSTPKLDLSVPLGIARFGELFGPEDRQHSHIVPRTISGLLSGHRVSGITGSSPRDFVFVQEAATACLTLAEAIATRGQALECTFRSGWELTEVEIASLIADVYAGRGGEPMRREVANPLGWNHAMSFSASMAETIAWVRGVTQVAVAPAQRRAA